MSKHMKLSKTVEKFSNKSKNYGKFNKQSKLTKNIQKRIKTFQKTPKVSKTSFLSNQDWKILLEKLIFLISTKFFQLNISLTFLLTKI